MSLITLTRLKAVSSDARIKCDCFQQQLDNEPRCWATKTRRHEEENSLTSYLRVFVKVDATESLRDYLLSQAAALPNHKDRKKRSLFFVPSCLRAY
jgi:hypothetical protein